MKRLYAKFPLHEMDELKAANTAILAELKRIMPVYLAAMRAFHSKLNGNPSLSVSEMLAHSYTKEGRALIRACARAEKKK